MSKREFAVPMWVMWAIVAWVLASGLVVQRVFAQAPDSTCLAVARVATDSLAKLHLTSTRLTAYQSRALRTLDSLHAGKCVFPPPPVHDTVYVPVPPDTTTPPDTTSPPDTTTPPDTSSPPPTGLADRPAPVAPFPSDLSSRPCTVTITAATQLQAALGSAGVVCLAPSLVLRGSWTAPKRTGPGWLVIRTAPVVVTAAEGARITPSLAAGLAHFVANGVSSATPLTLMGDSTALILVRISSDSALTGALTSALMIGSHASLTLAEQPTHVLVDRVYVHGYVGRSLTRGIALHAQHVRVTGSWVDEIHTAGADAQAIAGWNGPGPYRIDNNHLAGAGENIFFGGADPKIPGAISSDVTITGNHVYTPASWKGRAEVVKKNLLEMKAARRVLVEGNVFDGSWSDGQVGFGLLLKSSNQNGKCTWCTTTDVTIRRNLIRNVGAGFNIAAEGGSSYPIAGPTSRVVIEENWLEALNQGVFTGTGFLTQVLGSPTRPVAGLHILRNTLGTSGVIKQCLSLGNTNAPVSAHPFTWSGNACALGQYGVKADGGPAGAAAFAAKTPAGVLGPGTYVGTTSTAYPPGSVIVASWGAVTMGVTRAVIDAATAGAVVPP